MFVAACLCGSIALSLAAKPQAIQQERQEAEGILFSPSARDQREQGSESPTIISATGGQELGGVKAPFKFFTHYSCPQQDCLLYLENIPTQLTRSG